MKLKIFLTIIIFLLSVTPIFANDREFFTSISVMPAIVEGSFDPGQEKTIKVTIFNSSNFPIPIKAFAQSFLLNEKIVDDNWGHILNASRWMTIKPSEFILQPNTHKEIEIEISIPEDAEPGGHYATIYFEPLLPSDFKEGYMASVVGRVGVLSFLRVSGDITEDLQITEIIYPRLKQFFPFEIEAVLENQGNIHLLPKGRVELFNLLTNETKVVESIPSVIIPKTEKSYNFTLSENLSYGIYRASVQFDYGSLERKTEVHEISFWIFPIYWVLGTIFLLTFSTSLIIIYKERARLAFKVLFSKHVSK